MATGIAGNAGFVVGVHGALSNTGGEGSQGSNGSKACDDGEAYYDGGDGIGNSTGSGISSDSDSG